MKQLKQIITFSLFSFYFFNIYAQKVKINEIQSSNGSTFQDEDGDFEDWVELYNADTVDVSLKDWYLSDNPQKPKKWQFPDIIIKKGEFLVVFASSKDRLSGPFLHTNFGISANGEPIFISNNEGELIDSAEGPPIPRDISYGRANDGSEPFVFFDVPTPGFSNYFGQISSPNNLLEANYSSGFYTKEFALFFSDTLDNNGKIYYTTNGSEPDTNSILYTDSIWISDRSSDSNSISMIRTNPEDSPAEWVWKEPKGTIYKGTTIKARSFKNGVPTSAVTTSTFFITPEGRSKYSLPVLSLTIPSPELFDYDSGLYVPGKHFDIDGWYWHFGGGNYMQKGDNWNKKGHLCLIDTNNNVPLSRFVEVRLNGSSTKALPIKSFRLYSRNDFIGSTFDYSFFPNDTFKGYERIVLRNSGNDFGYSYLLDAFTQEIIKDLDIEKQKSQPAILFINGEYWGIHNIRERIDNRFLAYKKNVDKDNVDLIKYNGVGYEESEGSYTHFQTEVIDFISNNINNIDSKEVYTQIDSMIDLENYIDYHISKIYFGDIDWVGNNVRFWRERKVGSKYRWISYDNDGAFYERPYLNSMILATEEGKTEWPNPDFSTFLFRNLLKNTRFKDSFLNRFEYHMYNTFKIEDLDSILDKMASVIRPEIHEHTERWNYPSSKAKWEDNIENLHHSIALRTCYVKEMLYDFFNIKDNEYMEHICHNYNVKDIHTKNGFAIYPNPSKGEFTISFSNSFKNSENINIQIISIDGKVVYSEFNIDTPKELKLNLNSGIYFVKAFNNKINYTQKLIID